MISVSYSARQILVYTRMLCSSEAGQLLVAFCRRPIVLLPLLLLLLLGRACGKGICQALGRAPDAGRCLLPALLSLLCCHPLQQLLLVQHLRRQLALQLHGAPCQHSSST